MLSEVKRKIRKNKLLCKMAKGVYRPLYSLYRYPHNRRQTLKAERILGGISKSRNPLIWYLGTPTHLNLGDHAQAVCIRRWFAENYPGVSVAELPTRPLINCKRLFSLFENVTESGDLIFFQSGRNSSDDSKNEILHRLVAAAFPDNKIVFMPQTVVYSQRKELEKTAAIYNCHKNITFLARDKVSFETAADNFTSARVLLYPDIVTSQIGRYSPKAERSGILFCMRNDAEQLYEKSDIAALRARLSAFCETEMTDTHLSGKAAASALGDMLIDTVVEQYSKYKCIITDRYHGTIFSLAAGTPVVVLDSTDHKLSSGVEWFGGIYDDYVYYAKNLEQAENMAEKILQSSFSHEMDNYFEREYYAVLKSKLF